MPLYVRAGSIIPMGPFLQYSSEKQADPIELRIYTGADVVFNLYEDEGDSYNYEKGVYSIIPVSWNEKNATLTIGKRQGEYPGMLKERTFRIIWVGRNHGTGLGETEHEDSKVEYKGELIRIERLMN